MGAHERLPERTGVLALGSGEVAAHRIARSFKTVEWPAGAGLPRTVPADEWNRRETTG